MASRSSKCWLDNGDKEIISICEGQKPVGNMCCLICHATIGDCFPFHGSKDLVRSVTLNGSKAILKMKNLSILSEEYIQSLVSFEKHADQQAVFANALQGLVAFEIGNDDSMDVQNLLWPWQDIADLFNESKWLELRQILWFAHNDEFKLMQLHQHLSVFPELLGTCGNMYAVQHVAILLDSPLLDMLPAFMDICHAARSVSRILQYLRRLVTAFPGGLHLCDLKWSHFGEAPDGRLRFIDLDAAFLPAKMAATQRATDCRADADCHFFDCRGTCDQRRGRCRPQVSDNISNFCRQLVWPRAALLPGRLGLLGWLLDPEEAALLERCAEGGGATLASQVQELLAALEDRLCDAG
ncbi:divergent protein kinase domain 1C-like isoform X2 [Pollicipes pollicipes]|nr:divergent protein kinase domain 1C-like isoform X2 [Pollicipes pollicipes]